MYLEFNGVYSTDNYPYGRLKCKASFSVEFKTKKGCRSVFQTENPKTGRLNAPKQGTYHPLILPIQEANGHFGFSHFDTNGRRSQLRLFKLLSNQEIFKAINLPKEVQEHFLDLALYSLGISVAYANDVTAEKKFYVPAGKKITSMRRNQPTAADYRELFNLICLIPMKLYEKKEWVVDNRMLEGDDNAMYKQLNTMTEEEIDAVISVWEKAESLGAC